jgi:hypothetical protein
MSIESILQSIDSEVKKLEKARDILSAPSVVLTPIPTTKGKRLVKTGARTGIYVMSAAARARISERQKARWAKFHAEKEAKLQDSIKSSKAKAAKKK